MKAKTLGAVIILAGALTTLLFLQRRAAPPETPSLRESEQPRAKASPITKREGVATPETTTSPAPGPAPAKLTVPAPAQLWSAPAETSGEKLDPKSVSYLKAKATGTKLPGRSATFDSGSLASLAALQRGDNVVIPLLGDEQVTGRVNLVQTEASGQVLVGGELTGPRAGSFSLGSSGKKVGGTILFPKEEIAYEIAEQPDGRVLLLEKHLSEVICFQMPRPADEPVAVARGLVAQAVPPVLSSRPGVTAVLYLDFDGATVTDPSWNSGNTIVALPSALSSSEITDVWNRVKEDFSPFNIDVTTDLSRYNNAPVGRRMRCIITPTDGWYNTDRTDPTKIAGGVAKPNSFAQAGQGAFSSTIPCWVFLNSTAKYVADAISHELGHTLGLSHDGTRGDLLHLYRNSKDYYEGHGSGPVGWAPIMGVGYYKMLTQWSRGEYDNANNQEDDIAIISNSVNGFGFIADEAGNSRNSAATLQAPGGVVNQAGVISGDGDVDFFVFTVSSTTTVSIEANPDFTSPNLDILLDLESSTGTVLTSSNPDTALTAAINYTAPAGTYYIKVKGTGRGDVSGDGYSDYGSIGYYSLRGSLGAVNPPVAAPAITSVSPASFPSSASSRQIIIYGSNFKPSGDASASTLVFTYPDNSLSPTRTPSYVSSTELRYTSTFPTPGTWKVKVVNGPVESPPFTFNVSSGSAQLTGFSINGPAIVNKNSSGQFTATALFSDGASPTVSAAWSVSGSAASINSSSGQLTAGSVSSDTPVTVSASYTAGGITKTTSINVTIVNTGGGGGAQTQELVVNGGFENGSTGWSRNGNSGIVTLSFPRTGSGYSYLGNADNAIGSVHQFIAIPANATSVTLKFYLNVKTAEPTVGSPPYDQLDVNIRSTSDVLLRKLAPYSEADKGSNVDGNYVLKTLDLMDFRGQTVLLQFYCATDPSNVTIFRIDDVSVQVVVPAPVTLSSLAINGPSSVTEGNTAQYAATAIFSDGSTTTVTPSTWGENSSATTISSSGLLTAGQVSADTTVTLYASYTYSGVTREAYKDVTVVNQAATFSYLAISGPSSINENSSGQFTATAIFSDGFTQAASPSWSHNSGVASISSSGLLTATEVSSDTTVTVSASHTIGGVTRSASQNVTIINIPAPVTLVTLSISGLSSLNENSTAQYTATASFSDGLSQGVNPTWGEDSPATSISIFGLLSAGEVASDTSINVSASYTSGGITRSATKTVTILNTTVTPNYTVSSSAGSNGSVSPSAPQTVASGNSVSFTASPGTGYVVDQWLVDGTAVQTGGNSFTLANVTANRNVQVTFKTAPMDTTPPSLTITSPTSTATFSTSSATVDLAGSASDNVGVTQVTWSNDRGGSGTAGGTSTWTVSGVNLQNGQNVITVTARDATGNTGTAALIVTYTPPATYTVTTSASPLAGGTTSGGGSGLASGSSVTVVAVANSGYTFANWTEGGSLVSSSASYSFPLSGNRTLVANFSAIDAAIVIASGLNGPGSLVLDGNEVYFTENTASDGIVKRVSKNGGVVTTLVSGAILFDSGWRGVARFVVADGNIYGEYGGYANHAIFRSAADGSGTRTTLTTETGGAFIGVSGGNIYYGSGFSNLRSMSTNGGGANQVLGGYWVRGSAIDSTNVYFSPYGSWDVLRYNLASGVITTLITGNVGDVGLFLDDNNVYCNTSAGSIQKVSKNGGGVTTLVNSTSAVGGVSDGVNMYFVDNRAIQFVPVSGGAVGTLVTNGSFGGLAVDSTYLYYIDGSGGSGAAKIVKVPIRPNQTGQPGIPDFAWVARAGGAQDDYGISVAVDAAGNSLVTGGFAGSITFGTVTLVSAGGVDLFIVKYDPNGNVVWAKQAGGAGYEVGNGVCLDPSGNAYVTGIFKGAASFGSTNLTSGDSSVFIAKYDPSGNIVWVASAGTISHVNGGAAASIALDSAGNIFVGGSFWGAMTVGGTTLTSSGLNDVFVAKYDPAGNNVWVRRAGSAGYDHANVVRVDSAGNILLTGYFNAYGFANTTINFDSITLADAGGGDVFLTKYDNSGNVLWANRAGGSALENPQALAVDAGDNVYISGTYQGTTSFGGTSMSSTGYALFLAKYDRTGAMLWVKNTGANSGAGGNGLAIDAAGNLLLTGFFEGTVTFGNTNLTAQGGTDAFVARYDAAGDLQSARQIGSPGEDYGWAIAIDLAGNILATGFFNETATAGTNSLSSSGGRDIFVAKLGNVAQPIAPSITTQPVGQTVVAGGTVTFNVSVAGQPVPTYQWRKDGTNLANATSASLILNNLTINQSGRYSVVMTNVVGSVTSVPALLNVVSSLFHPPTHQTEVSIQTSGFTLDLNLEAGRTFRVQATTDFRTWTDVTSFTSTGAAFQFIDAAAMGQTRRFYRVVSP